MGENSFMGKVIDLKRFAMRSRDDSCHQGQDQLLYWDGQDLIELQDGLPIVDDDSQVIALGNRS
jgi:hypothetical protein